MLPPDILQLLAHCDEVRGTVTVDNATSRSIWDDGASVWFSDAPEYPDADPPYPWGDEDNTAIRQDLWDVDEVTGTTRYVVHPCKPQFANAWSATGKPHTIRLWVNTAPPVTPALQAQRDKMTVALDEWRANPAACRSAAASLPPGDSISLYHRWLSWRLLQP